jgi:nitroreductase
MIDSTELVSQLQWRYAVKSFDPVRKLSNETWNALEQALVLTPSSYGLQPWRFVVITDQAVKDQLPAISWTQTQPRDCSHMVVLAARRKIDEAYVDQFLESAAATRGIDVKSLGGYRGMMVQSTKRSDAELMHWSALQVYIALGQLMTAAAMLGVDTCPMEGIEATGYDKLLGLEGTGYATIVGCAVGYRNPGDKYAAAKKVRFPVEQVVTRI